MLSKFVDDSISAIEAVKQYYYTVLPNICESAEELRGQNFIGFLLTVYPRFATMPDDNEELARIKTSFLSVLNEHVTILDEKTDEKTFSFSFELKDSCKSKKYTLRTDIEDSGRKFMNSFDMVHIHHDNALISVIVKFEQFVSTVFRYLIRLFPDKYLSSKEIKYSDMLKIGPENIEKYLIDMVTEGIMRESMSTWFTMLETYQPKIKLDDMTLSDLKEAYYRRNIIVHNRAIINDSYLNGVASTHHAKAERNRTLHADPKYIDHIFNVVEITIYCIGLGLMKVEKEKLDGNLECFFDMGYRHMKREEWLVSEYLFRHLKDYPHMNAESKTMSLVNYWISSVHIDGVDAVRSEVDGCDFTAMHPRYILAKAILREDYKDAMALLDELFPKDINVRAIESWPLFIDFRKTEYYMSFRAKHLSEFEAQKYDAPLNDATSDDAIIDAFSDEKEAIENMMC